MEKATYRKILQDIARREGISALEVEREMQRAIDAGFANSSEEGRRAWERIPYKGDRPTVEEVIEGISRQLL